MGVPRLTRLLVRRRFRPFFLAGVAVLIIAEIVVLSPSSVEEGGKSQAVDPETLLDDENTTLATGIPKGIPEYSVDQFQYVSTQGGEKQWKLNADKAFLYNKENLVHSRNILAHLYDPDGKITVVRGKEAKYLMASRSGGAKKDKNSQRDLEVFGDVHAVFPDGFELRSEYLRFKPAERKIEIPSQYLVHGDGHEQNGQNFQFDSQGMDFAMARSQIILPQAVRMTFSKDKDDGTLIESDRAIIHRDKQVAYFTMSERRPLDTRFVHITQPTMYTRARRAEMRYGDYSKLLQYMVVFQDVLIKETTRKTPAAQSGKGSGKRKKNNAPSLRYATGGRADFDARTDVIRLTEFPQAYQDNDTVTGDVIILHRDSDLVEVEHSNAFSQGN